MNQGSLSGKLNAQLLHDYQVHTSVINQNQALVNRFGDAMAAFNLHPNAMVEEDGQLGLRAYADRTQDPQTIIDAMTSRGCSFGVAKKQPLRFADGFELWTISGTLGGMSFTMLYYVKAAA